LQQDKGYRNARAQNTWHGTHQFNIEIERDTKLGNQKGLVELIFRLPYCRVADVVSAQIAKRQTAAVYLLALADSGHLQVQVKGREKLFLNHRLLDLLKSDAMEDKSS
jgi:hypothetical protein